MSDRKICDECQSEIGSADKYWEMELTNEHGIASYFQYTPSRVDIHDGRCLHFFAAKRLNALADTRRDIRS